MYVFFFFAFFVFKLLHTGSPTNEENERQTRVSDNIEQDFANKKMGALYHRGSGQREPDIKISHSKMGFIFYSD